MLSSGQETQSESEICCSVRHIHSWCPYYLKIHINLQFHMLTALTNRPSWPYGQHVLCFKSDFRNNNYNTNRWLACVLNTIMFGFELSSSPPSSYIHPMFQSTQTVRKQQPVSEKLVLSQWYWCGCRSQPAAVGGFGLWNVPFLSSLHLVLLLLFGVWAAAQCC